MESVGGGSIHRKKDPTLRGSILTKEELYLGTEDNFSADESIVIGSESIVIFFTVYIHTVSDSRNF